MKANVFKKETFTKLFFDVFVKNLFLSVIITIVFAFAFGYKYIIVLSGSMTPTIPEDSLIIIKYMDIKDIDIGDVVTYRKKGNTVNVTHRVVAKDKQTGELVTAPDYLWLQTKPNGFGLVNKPYPNGVDAASPITQDEVVGVVVSYFKGVGKILQYLKENKNILTIGIILILFVAIFA